MVPWRVLLQHRNCVYQLRPATLRLHRPQRFPPTQHFQHLIMATTFAVPDGRVAMAATTYTGNGSTQAVSNAVNSVGMQPDLVWIKSRNQATNHALFDSVRGTGKVIQSNTTAAEATDNTTLTAFNASGFSLGAAAGSYVVNTSTYTFVGWCWKAGGTAVSNTAGSITSSVSANTTAGFSVVTYTGNGTISTVGHGLNAIPGMIIVKVRSTTANWPVYHSSLASTQNLLLDSSNAAAGGVIWTLTPPTTAVFGINTQASVNGSGATFVAYCWAPVAGYSAFGSYTGNGSADGPFIYTGFRPRWIMFKRTDTAGYNWHILDTSRSVSNAETLELYANLSDAETAYYSVLDGVSNGIKVRNADASVNASGGTYIYAAFAENPLKYANAR